LPVARKRVVLAALIERIEVRVDQIDIRDSLLEEAGFEPSVPLG
jgi:hypothetical protein